MGEVNRARGQNLPLTHHHIGPERLDLVGFQHVASGRHLVLAASYRIDEAVVLIERKLAQVERAFRIAHLRPMTGRAVALEDLGAGANLLRREALFTLCGDACHRERHRGADYPSPHHANLEITPASARRSTPSLRAARS